MSGVYIHIPFCAKKCYYCDFYTSLSIIYKEKYINAIIKELKLRQNYIENREIETIYFGEISKVFIIKKDSEITLEVNPDDINEQYADKLKITDINRISIGLQSFFDEDLKLMNRRHSGKENYKAIQVLKNYGLTNISGDLIYGLPGTNSEHWKKNLSEFFSLKIPHLSAYHLTYEPNTVFSNFIKRGKIFELLISEAKKHDFIHYETSNFAKKGFFSKHNTGYWKQKPYLGLGVSAHSYNLKSRQYNISNLKEYIKKVGEEERFFEKEELSETDKYNDYIITTLRTIWGTDLNYIKEHFKKEHYLFIA